MQSFVRLVSILVLLSLSSGCAAKSLSQAFKQVDPSVVVIHTADSKQVISNRGHLVSDTQEGLGSGVIISDKGEILTAAHVIQTADQLSVKLVDGSEYAAKVVSSSPFTDLALIQILNPPPGLKPSIMGDSDKVDVGDDVFVIGTPYGIEHTLTAGYVSGKRYSELSPWGDPIELIQTDAAINRGNSGGPMFNRKGELIGIVSHIRSGSGGSEGLGFAASINMAKAQLLEKPAFWSGLELIPVQGSLAKALNVPYGAGFVVQSVAQGSVADRLGLVPGNVPITYGGVELLIGGDIITKIGDQNIYLSKRALSALMTKVSDYKTQEHFRVTVLREGKEVELSTRLSDD